VDGRTVVLPGPFGRNQGHERLLIPYWLMLLAIERICFLLGVLSAYCSLQFGAAAKEEMALSAPQR